MGVLLITEFEMRVHIFGLLTFLLCLILYYILILKKRSHKSDSKLNDIINVVNRLCLHRLESIKRGYLFVNEFQKIYKRVNPYHVLVNNFVWCDKIKNFKYNNIIRIKEGVHPFETFKELTNIPLSNSCFLNEMITEHKKWMYVEYSENSKYKATLPYIKSSYVFLRSENNMPIFVCVVSYDEYVTLTEEEISDISDTIQKISF